ncbi:YbjN domain-containing protein [Paenibacillus psychroresistens]|uniref:YbjN domain-containing protein n=1 Tax=Paenibacillus psychroresistens TaxID=1778678 RepID=A0A6B8RCK7_9BACL|nr:YbjN domain-containing protein [Paenibacillus psychroresistens]QGQ93747.1 YbjN domain-containing protein [Paenibacillus psychroresistens]
MGRKEWNCMAIDDNDDAQIQLNHVIQFNSLAGEILETRATMLSLSWKNDKPQFTLLFEVSKMTYETILSQESFGLYPNVRTGGAEIEFTPSNPIELNVVLRQPLSDAFVARGEDIEDVLACLLQPDQKAGGALINSESWLATEVKQLIELPGDLVNKGSLKSGYRTAWIDILIDKRTTSVVSEIEEASLVVSLNEVIESYFSAKEWAFERLDDSLLRLAVKGEQGDWVTLVQTDEEDQRCIVYSVYPDLVPESRREAMAAILTQENYEMPVGNFEMDLTDGEVRFRTSIEVVKHQFTSEWFERMFMVNISITDGYFALISGEINIEQ